MLILSFFIELSQWLAIKILLNENAVLLEPSRDTLHSLIVRLQVFSERPLSISDFRAQTTKQRNVGRPFRVRMNATIGLTDVRLTITHSQCT